MATRPEVKFLADSESAYGKSIVVALMNLPVPTCTSVDEALGRDVLFARETAVLLTSKDAGLLACLLNNIVGGTLVGISTEQMVIAANLAGALGQRNCSALGTYQQF